MKTQKLFSLDQEIVDRIRLEDNASALVNSLLMIHYADLKSEDEIIAGVKDKVTKAKKKAKLQKMIDKQLAKEKKDGL